MLSRYVSSPHPLFAIRVCDPFMQLTIKKAPSAQFILNGILKIIPYLGSREKAYISLAKGAKLIIDGDLTIGNGTQIFLGEGAELYIGGVRNETDSGITERSRIMVKRKILIGVDCIIAWGVYITDCDWHSIEGTMSHEDVHIGNHVWVAPNCAILKGSIIGNDCIIGAHSVITGQTIPAASLATGSPAHVVRQSVLWHRELPEQG